MTIEQALEAIRKASDEARKAGATEHQIIAAIAQREKTDPMAEGGKKALSGKS
jgi:mannitol/fructose-specific phosphotransferase system IIA component (Ntr-type)